MPLQLAKEAHKTIPMPKFFYIPTTSCLLMVLLLTATPTTAQKLYVVHVEGNIVNKNTKSMLAVGDKISLADTLVFEDANARAVAMGREHGRVQLSPSAIKKASGTMQFVAFVRETILPMKDNQIMSTRGKIASLLELKEYFHHMPILVMEELRLHLDTIAFNPSEIRFSVQVAHSSNALLRELPIQQGHLCLARQHLAPDEGMRPLFFPDVKLFYQMAGSEPMLLATFNLHAVPMAYIASQAKVIKSVVSSKRFEDEVIAFLHSTYGKFDDKEFARLDLE